MTTTDNLLDSQFNEEYTKVTDDQLATGTKRFLNSLIDGIVIQIINYAYFYVTGPLSSRYDIYDDNPAISLARGGAVYIILILYYVVLESVYGKTIGKMATGTKVVDLYGNKPDAKKALLRTICRFIPFDAFSFLGSPSKGWHDTLASCSE